MIAQVRRLTAQPRRTVLGSFVLVLVFVLWVVQHRRSGNVWGTFGRSGVRSPMAVPPSLFPTAESADILGRLPKPLKPKATLMRVPNSVHYVYGLKPVPEGQEVPALPYYAYLAMRSALINLKPEKMYFHYNHEPTGPWWDLIKPHLTLLKTAVPTTIYGREVGHFAHKADLVRLWVLERMGGIYLDIDMFVIRDFDDLLYAPTTMGMEASPDSRRTAMQPTGLCNGVIIAEPHARFLQNWLKTYVTFNGDNWAGHSVDKPWELAQLFPDDVQVLDHRAMFWPLWSGEEIQIVHEEDRYDWSKQYSYHAWESLAMKYLAKLNPRDIRANSTSFHRLVRPFIGPTDEDVFRSLS